MKSEILMPLPIDQAIYYQENVIGNLKLIELTQEIL